MSSKNVRLLLVDDHLLVRDGLQCLLSHSDDIEVVAVTADADEAVEVAESLRPDVVLIDYGLLGPEPAGLLIEFGSRAPGLRVIVLTSGQAARPALTALRAGVLGLVHKSDSARDLLAAVAAVGRGDRFVSPSLAGLLARRLDADEQVDAVLDTLSSRERELLRFIAAGQTLREASRTMNISESTASTYRQRLLRKLRVSNTAQLIRFALLHGLEA